MGIAQYDANKIQGMLEKIEMPERKNYFEGLGVNLSNVTNKESNYQSEDDGDSSIEVTKAILTKQQ